MSHPHPDLERLHRREPSRAADLVGTLAHPAVVLGGTVLALGVRAVWPRVVVGLGWGLVTLVLVVGLPLSVLWVALRLGWVSDPHVVRREERLRPLLWTIGTIGAGISVGWSIGVPDELRCLMIALLAGTGAMALVTVLLDKVSFHAAGFSAATVILGAEFGPGVWRVGVALLLAVGWARVRAGRHTLRQVALGALVGAGVVGGSYLALV